MAVVTRLIALARSFAFNARNKRQGQPKAVVTITIGAWSEVVGRGDYREARFTA